ncbi:Mrp family chromosome partitioning ATPase [Thermosporothrix hazakensis]|uniref:Mrp family chromosome partitioning ATPase n=1 Tax=Thermosporothrix hazakensis TaxID=644383 RepID=A0A326UAE1_THEHA|nr:CpsD/CapB family tyrosine-protein kinase [Thermosporothrix hazakensis]PZW33020.1 Mrp family chromosome partitioning ATPase [Thermosporothrix hazakensis]GCE49051.1 tyrosine protein kinase [Thermosporothrix hazakensis]
MGTSDKEKLALLTDFDSSSAYSRAFHTFYTNLRLSWDVEQFKQYVILVATPVSSQGRVYTCANLAIAAALHGTTTVLVDADVQEPKLHTYFGINSVNGLSDLLAEEEAIENRVATMCNETFVSGLSLLTAGMTKLTELDVQRLLLKHSASLVAGLRSYLSWKTAEPGLIIFNCAPILMNVNASIVSAVVDQTFLLIENGRTSYAQAKQAQEQLLRAHARIAGVIMMDG